MRWQISLGSSRKLSFTWRRFRTQTKRRSTKFKQYVYQFALLGYRELAIAYKWNARSKQSKLAYRPGNVLRRAASPVLVILLGLFGSLYFSFNLKKPISLAPLHAYAAPEQVQPAAATPKTLVRSVPTHLTIPKAGIDTDLTTTGLNSIGGIQMPDVFDEAAWFTSSPTPGELGPSIIVGHVDRVDGIAVFWNLRELAPGDSIQVSRADGSIATFKVVEVDQFSQSNFPTAKVYGNIDYAGLRLITCSGTFDNETGHYNDNLVVSAALE